MEGEKIDLKEVLELFLEEQKLEFENITVNEKFIKKFVAYLIHNGYSFSKIELAKALKISRTSLYRRLKNG